MENATSFALNCNRLQFSAGLVRRPDVFSIIRRQGSIDMPSENTSRRPTFKPCALIGVSGRRKPIFEPHGRSLSSRAADRPDFG
jgi:hypothetical protein